MGYQKLALFLLYIAFLCQLVFSSSLPHLCPKNQALALLQFKHMFTINASANSDCDPSYPTTLSWNKSTDCCSWDGVYCEETTGQVIELNLNCSQLQGKFDSNSSLFLLSNLKRLDLSHNNFFGSLISPKFGEFSSLTHLDLGVSGFSGLIPSEISHLSKLYFLRIGSYDPSRLRLVPHNFELLLKNLTQLRVLNLFYVNISSTIPLNFSSFLTTLWLPDTQLFGILPERVFHLSNLKDLYLLDNPQLTVGFPTTKWNSSASLMGLYLDGVNFTGRIPESFSYLTSLQTFYMSYSNLAGPIPKPIWNLTSIKVLSLKGNNLNGQIECLSCNQSWTQLEWLDFSSNSLTSLIPSCIFSLPSLFVLDLSNNSFNGKIQDFKSKILGEVVLKQNQLEGPIPKSLLNQQSLEYLLLSQNNLSGQIDSNICNLKKLTLLDLGSNNLEGSIPHCLGGMSELWVLDVSNNSLSGTINTTFGIRNNIIILKLDMNKLQGKVPRSLINCKNLVLLDLGKNELNDTFPNWLGALPQLQILSLRSNKLHGPMKDSRAENLFAQIRIIDLSSNGFSGELPVSLFENFRAMKKIDENSETREYVADVTAYNYRSSLIVTTKGLDFELPRVLTTNIVIDLSNNRFGGCIPSIIGDLIGLRTLNLSHNGLEGHIPASLQRLSVLESLDLSSNKIGGEIPQELASLTSLEFLHLSHNHLVGCIPKGNQFNTFENNSYQGNDGLHGFPLSKYCGGDDGVPQGTTPVEVDQGEGDSAMISWQAFLMGYGCGLIIVLSVIYIMLATQNPAWFSRMVEELEHRIITRMKRHKKRN